MKVATNVIYCDDNLNRLALMPAESVDLAYLDPPFFSNQQYDVVWGDEAEVRSFEDSWDGGARAYTTWLRERVLEVRRVLKPTGSLYLHCDWRASHHCKVMLDELFGEGRFQNEIIWSRVATGPAARRWRESHDTILFYTKGATWTFNPEIGQGPIRGVDRIGYDRPSNDVWAEPRAATQSGDRFRYPTQRPSALMERIIRASSNEGDVVLDPFAGSGTTLLAALKLGRPWIGIEISPTAVGLIRRRLQRADAIGITVEGLPTTESDLRRLRPYEFENWVMQRMNGTHSPRKSGDMGIDGYSYLEHFPIQVKRAGRVGRAVTTSFIAALARTGHKRGFIVAFSFTVSAFEEADRVAESGVRVDLITVDELLKSSWPLDVSQGSQGDGLPLPAIRSDSARPTSHELVKSDRKAPDADS